MKYARIVNSTAVDVRTESPEGCFTPNIVAEFVTVPNQVESGWTVEGGEWSAPIVPEPHVPTAEEIAAAELAAFKATVPAQVTMRQARLALLAAGLLGAVETAIAGAGAAAQIEWEYAQVVERNAGLVPAMATALGMTERQIDDLFIAAAAL